MYASPVYERRNEQSQLRTQIVFSACSSKRLPSGSVSRWSETCTIFRLSNHVKIKVMTIIDARTGASESRRAVPPRKSSRPLGSLQKTRYATAQEPSERSRHTCGTSLESSMLSALVAALRTSAKGRLRLKVFTCRLDIDAV